MKRILVVDDDALARRELADTIREAGYDALEAGSVAQAMRLLLSWKPNAIVLDLVLPDGHGRQVVSAMRMIATTKHTRVIAVTASASSVGFVDPGTFGAETILVKPVPRDALIAALRRNLGEATHALLRDDATSVPRDGVA